ncbi:MAG: hypothetical protein HXM76_07115 [Mogibacterium diversum]|nr:hypothetical protein [Mogibacterium diversum]
MAKFDFGKGLKSLQNKIQDTAEIVKKSAKEIKISEKIDLESVKRIADKAADSAKKAVGTVADSTKKAVEEVGKNLEQATKKKPERTENVPDGAVRVLSTESAIKIIYYLISVDGVINGAELEKLNEICLNLDPKFEEYRDALIASCKQELDKQIDEEDYYDILQDAVENAIQKSKPRQDSFITPKLLLWDLLTIAYSDDTYNEEERKLMKYLAHRINVDIAVFLELESSVLTIMDIEKEIKWIKTTNRPYLTIEAMVNELVDRRNVVFEGVKELITL